MSRRGNLKRRMERNGQHWVGCSVVIYTCQSLLFYFSGSLQLAWCVAIEDQWRRVSLCVCEWLRSSSNRTTQLAQNRKNQVQPARRVRLLGALAPRFLNPELYQQDNGGCVIGHRSQAVKLDIFSGHAARTGCAFHPLYLSLRVYCAPHVDGTFFPHGRLSEL